MRDQFTTSDLGAIGARMAELGVEAKVTAFDYGETLLIVHDQVGLTMSARDRLDGATERPSNNEIAEAAVRKLNGQD